MFITDSSSENFPGTNNIIENNIDINGDAPRDPFSYSEDQDPNSPYLPITKVYGPAGIHIIGNVLNGQPETESWNINDNTIQLKGAGIRGITLWETLNTNVLKNKITSEKTSSVLIGAQNTINTTIEENILDARGEKSAGIVGVSVQDFKATNDKITTLPDGNSTIIMIGSNTNRLSTARYTNVTI